MSGPVELRVCPHLLDEFRAAAGVLEPGAVQLRAGSTTCAGTCRPAQPAPPPPDPEAIDLCCLPRQQAPGTPPRVEQCFHLLAPRAAVGAWQRAGAFLVTPGWLRHWEPQLQLWGFDRESARAFFAEATREVVLLDTGVSAEATGWCQAFAGHVGLPWRTVPVGLDHLQAKLEAVVAAHRLAAAEAEAARAGKRLAELSMALELGRELAGATTEAEVARRVLTLFQTLFAPTALTYRSLDEGHPCWRWPEQGPVPAAVPPGSFVVPLTARGQRVAVVSVEGVRFADRLEDYLELGRAIAELCALAVVAARAASRERRAELALRQSEKLGSLGRLSAGLAHELNTPAQVLSDNLHLLREGLVVLGQVQASHRALAEAVASGRATPADGARALALEGDAEVPFWLEQLPRSVEHAWLGVERVARIVRSMRDFARPGSQGQEVVELNQLVRATLEVTRPLHGPVAELKAELGELPPVRCVPADLNLALFNLVANAAQAIADRGPGQRGTLTVRTALAGGCAVVEVADTGVGIPEALREHLFEQFFTTREPGQGTGQGLATAWRVVVEQHRGTLGFESEVGVGSTFRLTLPLEPPPASAALSVGS